MNKWSAAGTDERSSAAVDMLLTRLSILGLRELERLALSVERRLQDFDERVGDEDEYKRVRLLVQQEFERITQGLLGATPDNPPAEAVVTGFKDRLDALWLALTRSSTAAEFRHHLAMLESQRYADRMREMEEAEGTTHGAAREEDDEAALADPPRAAAEPPSPRGGIHAPRYHDFARRRFGFPSEVALLLAGIATIGANASSHGLPTLRQGGAVLAFVLFYCAAKRIWHRLYVRRTWRYRVTVEHAQVYRDAVGLYLLRTETM